MDSQLRYLSDEEVASLVIEEMLGPDKSKRHSGHGAATRRAANRPIKMLSFKWIRRLNKQC